jgi:hypothetical protein
VRDTSGSKPEDQLAPTTGARGERRRQPRANLALHGRYVLADGREHACTVIDASASALALSAAERGRIGERVVVTFDNIGKIEGDIAHLVPEGFVIRLVGRSRAAQALADLVERQYGGKAPVRPLEG